jgi:heme/copper-type cytochrome/quinol oxidase subunit 3
MSEAVLRPGPLPVGPQAGRGAAFWGVSALIATEASVFAYLLFSYYYFDVQSPASWRPSESPDLKLALPNTLILLASSVAVFFGERAIRAGRRRRSCALVCLAFLMGAVFATIQYFEWKAKSYSPQSSPYASLYFTITSFHMAHVLAGLVALLLTTIWIGRGYFDEGRNAAVGNVALYWHFVDAVWIFVFLTFYVTPYLW